MLIPTANTTPGTLSFLYNKGTSLQWFLYTTRDSTNPYTKYNTMYSNSYVNIDPTLIATSKYIFIFIRAKRVSNWYIPKKKSARVPVCRVHVCTCVRLIILVLVCGIMYHIRTYLVSARYQPATKIRICRYVCARVGYVLCATYVRKLVWARLFVPGISRLPRYVHVDTYVPVAEITWK